MDPITHFGWLRIKEFNTLKLARQIEQENYRMFSQYHSFQEMTVKPAIVQVHG